MVEILEKISNLVPVAIVLSLATFLYFRRQYELSISRYSILEKEPEEQHNREEANQAISILVQRGDVELRVLEEIVEIDRPRSLFFFGGRSRKELALDAIKRQLRALLKSSVGDESGFEEIKVRVLSLLDEINRQLTDLHRKAPFEGLEDPERSLLIDLLEEVPEERELQRQKAYQLADILKAKHQDIKNLQLQNTKSANWTRWGTVGTISFGFLSFGLSLYALAV